MRAFTRRSPESRARRNMPSSVSARRCRVRRRSIRPTSIDRRAMRFLGEGAAWNHIAMEQAIQDSGLEPTEVSNIRTGIIMGSGGPSARTIVEAADITREQGAEAGRAVRGAEGDVVDGLRDARHLVQDQGRELFDLVGLRDLEPLHRQCLRDDPDRQAGHHLRRRLRGTRLVAVGAVRRDGRDVVEIQRHARDRLASLRHQPRRLRDCRRRRRAWCWKSSSTPRRAARASTAKSSATARPPTATTWSRRRARAPSAACAWRWRR